MADQTANVVLTADVSNYTSQIGQAEQETNSFIGSVDRLSDKLTTLTKASGRGLMFIGAGTLATFATATARAAAFQKEMSTLRATAAATGKDISETERSIQKLAVTFPIARSEAVALYTQLNNLGIKGTKNIENLAGTMVRLGGATGESIGGLTQGFVELSRSMGTLSGGQSQRYANALYTVSRNAGVAASSVLAFSNAIAPMARVTGIGMQEVLGISTAFTKAGADGYYAANTFSSMLADISRQVQYGSPNIRKYSDLIGVTAAEFAKMDRTEAITRIFETIGKSGPEAVKILDKMGYDGIRAARSITAVATSAGGIRKAVADATGSFNGNELNKGSEAAYKSLATELEQTKDLLDSIGTTIGSGMLGPLREVANVFNKILGTASNLISALRPLGNVLAPLTALIVGGGALALGGVLKSLGVVTGLATARYFTTTATGSSIAAGFRAGQGYSSEQMKNPLTARAADRFTMASMLRGNGLNAEANRVMSPIQRFMYTTSQGVGAAYGMPREGGPGMLSRTLALPIRAAGALVGWNTQFYKDAIARDPFDRQRLLPSGFMGGWRSVGGEGGVAGGAGSFANSFRALTNTSVGLSAALGGLTRSVAQMTFAATRAASSMLAMGAMGVVRGAGSMLATLGMNGPMLGLLAGITAFTTWNNDRKRAAELADPDNFNPSMGLQRVNEKLGIASAETGRAPQSEREKEAALSTPMTPLQALVFDDRQRTIAEAPNRKYVNQLFEYAQSPEEAAALTRAGGVLTPVQLQQYGFDAMQRFGLGDERKYRSLVLNNNDPFKIDAKDPSGVVGTLKMANRMSKDTYAGWWDQTLMGLGQTAKWGNRAISALWGGEGSNDWNSNGLTRTSERRMTKETEATVDEAISGIGRLINSADKKGYSKNVGNQLAVMEFGKTLEFLADPNTSAGVFSKAIAGLESTFGVKTNLKNGKLSDEQYQKLADAAPQDRAKLLQSFLFDPKTDEGKKWNETYGRYEGTQAEQRKRVQEYMKEDTSSPLVYQLRAMGPLGDLALKTNANLLGKEGDPIEVGKAMEQLAQEAMKTGKSFGDISVDLSAAADRLSAFENATAEVVKAALSLVMKFRELAQVTMSRTERREDNYKFGKDLMKSQNAEIRAQGRDVLIQQTTDDYNFIRQANQTLREYGVSKDRYKADYARTVALSNRDFNKAMARGAEDFEYSQRISKEDYEISKGYAKEDFARQQKYSRADYDKSVQRAEEDFRKQESRATADFQKSMSRATEDFNLSRSRSYDDFYRGQARSQDDFVRSQSRGLDDFNRSRLRAQEDFDRSMVRRAQAAAREIYAPFQRISTLQTMDAANLVINLDKQNKMIQDQVKNLQQLKDSGLTQDVIDALGLAQAGNAQQVARLVSDMGTNPSLIQDLNRSVKERLANTGSLVNSDLNVDYRQTKEDFALSLTRGSEDFALATRRSTDDFALAQERSTSDFMLAMSRSQDDFSKQMTRSTDDFVLQMDRARSDFALQMTRGAVDFEEVSRRSAEAFDISMTRMAAAFDRSTALALYQYELNRKRATEDHKTMLGDMEFSYKQTLERMQQDLIRSFQDISGSIDELSKKTMAMLGEQLGSAGNKIKSEISSIVVSYKTAMNYISGGYWNPGKNPITEQGNKDVDPLWGIPKNAAGGIVTKTTLSWVGEGGYPEAIVPLNSRGAAFMASTIKEALASMYASPTQYQGSTGVTNIDKSTQFNGAITVVSNDPNEMARRLEEQSRLRRLVRSV